MNAILVEPVALDEVVLAGDALALPGVVRRLVLLGGTAKRHLETTLVVFFLGLFGGLCRHVFLDLLDVDADRPLGTAGGLGALSPDLVAAAMADALVGVDLLHTIDVVLSSHREVVPGLVGGLARVVVAGAVDHPGGDLLFDGLDELDDRVDDVVVESAEGGAAVDAGLLGDDAGRSTADAVHLREGPLDGLRPIEVRLPDADEVSDVVVLLLGFFCTHVWMLSASWRGFEPRRLAPQS